MKNVAIMFYGSHRTIFECWTSLRWLLDPTKYTITPFFYFWDTGDETRNKGIVELIKPALYWFGEVPDVKIVSKQLQEKHKSHPITYSSTVSMESFISGIFLRCYGMAQVNQVRLEYERLHNMSFDWYLVIRPDVRSFACGIDLEAEINSSQRLYGGYSRSEDVYNSQFTLRSVDKYAARMLYDGPAEFITGEPVTANTLGLDVYKRPMGMVDPGFKLSDDDNIAVLPNRPHYGAWNDQVVFLTKRSVNTWTRQYEWMITDMVSGKESWFLWPEMFTKQWNHHVNGTRMVTIPFDFEVWRPEDYRDPSTHQWIWNRK